MWCDGVRCGRVWCGVVWCGVELWYVVVACDFALKQCHAALFGIMGWLINFLFNFINKW